MLYNALSRDTNTPHLYKYAELGVIVATIMEATHTQGIRPYALCVLSQRYSSAQPGLRRLHSVIYVVGSVACLS